MRITKGEGGVYCWLNKMNNKRYGSAGSINLKGILEDCQIIIHFRLNIRVNQ